MRFSACCADEEVVEGDVFMLIRPLMTRKSLDERFHKISGGKAGTITSVAGEGALATVRWDVTPSEEHQYRTGRFGRFELVCKRTLNIQTRDDDTILRTLQQCMTASRFHVYNIG
jgi:hypothetical protein